MDTMSKLGILSEAARFDAACTSSGVSRAPQVGRVGMAQAAGCCHSFTPDGRCITLLKVLMSNVCSYDCAYCVNRRQASCERATFTPHELAELTVSFYRRNYIEGLFLSSVVLATPDATTEQMIACLRVLRDELRFNGYIHAKVIPGTDPELVDALGRLADRLSVNLELPSTTSLALLCPDKSKSDVLGPMAQIRQTRVAEERALLANGRRGGRRRLPISLAAETTSVIGPFQPNGEDNATAGGSKTSTAKDRHAWSTALSLHGEGADATSSLPLYTNGNEFVVRPPSSVPNAWRSFAPAGQSTQLIVGATGESDHHILRLAQALYRHYDLKRIFFSAYMPMMQDARLPGCEVPAPLRREHRLYQADWLMRYYAFTPDELVTTDAPWLDLDVDPKLAWALAHMDRFPVEVMDAPLELLLRVPGVGVVGARRIVAVRKTRSLSFDDLRRLRITLKRACYFITCAGKRAVAGSFDAATIREKVLSDAQRTAYNRAQRRVEGQLALF